MYMGLENFVTASLTTFTIPAWEHALNKTRPLPNTSTAT